MTDKSLVLIENIAVMLLRHIQSWEAIEFKHKTKLSRKNLPFPDKVKKFEEELIKIALIRTNCNQRRAARLLGVNVTTLNSKIKRLRIDTSELMNNLEMYEALMTIY